MTSLEEHLLLLIFYKSDSVFWMRTNINLTGTLRISSLSVLLRSFVFVGGIFAGVALCSVNLEFDTFCVIISPQISLTVVNL